MASTNPFKGNWFMSLSVMRDANNDNLGYPMGRKGQLRIVDDPGKPNGIILTLTHPGNPRQPATTFEGTYTPASDVAPATLSAESESPGNDGYEFYLTGFLNSDFPPGARSIVGGFYCRLPGGAESMADADADGSWLGSEGP